MLGSSAWPLNSHNCSENYTKTENSGVAKLSVTGAAETQFGACGVFYRGRFIKARSLFIGSFINFVLFIVHDNS